MPAKLLYYTDACWDYQRAGWTSGWSQASASRCDKKRHHQPTTPDMSWGQQVTFLVLLSGPTQCDRIPFAQPGRRPSRLPTTLTRPPNVGRDRSLRQVSRGHRDRPSIVSKLTRWVRCLGEFPRRVGIKTDTRQCRQKLKSAGILGTW